MLDNLIVLGVSTVISVFLPIFDIDIGDTADEEFEFPLVEDVD
jgi:hypothetical protein